MKPFWVGLGVSTGLGVLAMFLKGSSREQRVRGKLDTWAQAADDAVSKSRSNPVASVSAVEEDLSLNTVSREKLLQVYGIGPVLADRIIANRPYHSDYEIVERGIIPESGYKRLKSQLLSRRAG